MEVFMRSSRHFKTISQILIFVMLHLCWLTSYGYAEMIPTESAIEQPSHDVTDRQRLLDLLDRQEVVDKLEEYSISKVEAVARINSLTDEEVIEITGKLDQLPEGGYVELIFLYIKVGMAFGYIFFWLPALSIFCPFSEKSYGECISYHSGRYWEIISKNDGGGGGYPDTDAGLEYCKSDCQSDFDGCMESADGEKGEEQECKDDNSKCDKKCSDWAYGDNKGLKGILQSTFPGGYGPKNVEENEKLNKDSQQKPQQPQAETPCVGQFNSCIQWAGTPQQEEECNEDKQMCLQVFTPCDTNYSTCLSKVGRAISSDRYCVEEKQKCIKKIME
jgi:hypothetical protein